MPTFLDTIDLSDDRANMTNPIVGAKYEIENPDRAVSDILKRLTHFLGSNHTLTIQDSGLKIYMNILGIQHLRKYYQNSIGEIYFSGVDTDLSYKYITTPRAKMTLGNKI